MLLHVAIACSFSLPSANPKVYSLHSTVDGRRNSAAKHVLAVSFGEHTCVCISVAMDLRVELCYADKVLFLNN